MKNPNISEMNAFLKESEFNILVNYVLNNKLKTSHKNYINNHNTDVIKENEDYIYRQKQKINKLIKQVLELKESKTLMQKDNEKEKKKQILYLIKEIRNLSISKYGFIYPEARRIFYSFILDSQYSSNYSYNCLNFDKIDSNNFKSLLNKVNEDKTDNMENSDLFTTQTKQIFTSLMISNESNHNRCIISKKQSISNFHNEIKHEYLDIVKNDVYRSRINSLFPIEKYHDTNCLLKQKLHKIVISFSDILDKRYNYCQGYHDMALLFYILYQLEENSALEIIQRFTEFFMKESLNNKADHNIFGFNEENEIVRTLCLEYNYSLAEEMIGLFDNNLFFVFPWIITYFSHHLTDLNKQFRLLDYIICSNPNTIYYLSAVIAIEQYKGFKEIYISSNPQIFKHQVSENSNILDIKLNIENVEMSDLFKYFQSLSYNEFDFDDYIIKCEKFKNKSFDNKDYSKILLYRNTNVSEQDCIK